MVEECSNVSALSYYEDVNPEPAQLQRRLPVPQLRKVQGFTVRYMRLAPGMVLG